MRPGTVDTTGAGDTFCACCLHAVLREGQPAPANAEALEKMLAFANAAAALVMMRKGALCAMPEQNAAETLVAQRLGGTS